MPERIRKKLLLESEKPGIRETHIIPIFNGDESGSRKKDDDPAKGD
jgi:hypothetical protein